MKSRASTSVVMFDVVYQDGTRSSSRRVPASALEGLDGDEPARALIEAQDRVISQASGRSRSDVKVILRSPVKAASDDQTPARKARGAKQ